MDLGLRIELFWFESVIVGIRFDLLCLLALKSGLVMIKGEPPEESDIKVSEFFSGRTLRLSFLWKFLSIYGECLIISVYLFGLIGSNCNDTYRTFINSMESKI